MGFSRPEYWSELPFPSPEDLPDPGIEPESPELQADSSPSELPVLHSAADAAAKSLQLCPTLCDPIDGSSPGSPVSGILQARTLEWVAISFSNTWKWKVKVKSLSCVQLFVTPWTAAHQAPPSMGFSRQEYWSAVPVLKSGCATDSPISKQCKWNNGPRREPLSLSPVTLQLPSSFPCLNSTSKHWTLSLQAWGRLSIPCLDFSELANICWLPTIKEEDLVLSNYFHSRISFTVFLQYYKNYNIVIFCWINIQCLE